MTARIQILILVGGLLCGCGRSTGTRGCSGDSGPTPTGHSTPSSPPGDLDPAGDNPTTPLPPHPAATTETTSVTQWGITWEFDRSVPAGQFITGDWWVIGPVTVVSVSPGPAAGDPASEDYDTGGNQFGDAALTVDNRMRNGSMIVLQQTSRQGYDSRVINFDPSLSVQFPVKLEANRSLVSTISLKDCTGNPNFVQGHFEDSWGVLETAAVLTVLAEPPPADAFRPSYAGTTKRIFRASALRTDILPRLATVADTPSFVLYERYFERVWLDHNHHWTQAWVAPIDNCPAYGREYARVTSQAALLLCLDVPLADKRTLLHRFVQLGIDLAGVAQVGGTWPGEGGIWVGRKLPVVMAAALLGDESLLPDVFSIGNRYSEDQQTYYGLHFNGVDTALFQMGLHHVPAHPYEHKDPATWDSQDQRSESYRKCCTGNALVGAALAGRHMKLMKAWGHNAFFDYMDRFMREHAVDPSSSRYASLDTFVINMWTAHRDAAPAQAPGAHDLMWVWDNGGKWVDNPPP